MNVTSEIVVLTKDQLKEFAAEVVREVMGIVEPPVTIEPADPSTVYVYGLRGIMELFGVSQLTAQRYKNTFLRPAVSQRGRKITVDVNKARQLFDEHRSATPDVQA